MSFFKKTALFSIALSAFLFPACGGNDSNDDGDNNGKVDTEHSDLVQSLPNRTELRLVADGLLQQPMTETGVARISPSDAHIV